MFGDVHDDDGEAGEQAAGGLDAELLEMFEVGPGEGREAGGGGGDDSFDHDAHGDDEVLKLLEVGSGEGREAGDGGGDSFDHDGLWTPVGDEEAEERGCLDVEVDDIADSKCDGGCTPNIDHHYHGRDSSFLDDFQKLLADYVAPAGTPEAPRNGKLTRRTGLMSDAELFRRSLWRKYGEAHFWTHAAVGQV